MAGVEALTSCLDLLTLLTTFYLYVLFAQWSEICCLLSGHNFSLKSKYISRKNEIAEMILIRYYFDFEF